ncbi:unnamed protein product [Diplocarpon coronariae]
MHDQSLERFVPNENNAQHSVHDLLAYLDEHEGGFKSPYALAKPWVHRPSNSDSDSCNTSSSRRKAKGESKGESKRESKSKGKGKSKARAKAKARGTLGTSKLNINSSSPGGSSSSSPALWSHHSSMSSTRRPRKNMDSNSRSDFTLPCPLDDENSHDISPIAVRRSSPGYWNRHGSVIRPGSASMFLHQDPGWDGVGKGKAKEQGHMGPPAVPGVNAPQHQEAHRGSVGGNPTTSGAVHVPPIPPSQPFLRPEPPLQVALPPHSPPPLGSTVSAGTQILLDTLAQRVVGAHCGEMAEVTGIETLEVAEWIEDLLELVPFV